MPDNSTLDHGAGSAQHKNISLLTCWSTTCIRCYRGWWLMDWVMQRPGWSSLQSGSCQPTVWILKPVLWRRTGVQSRVTFSERHCGQGRADVYPSSLVSVCSGFAFLIKYCFFSSSDWGRNLNCCFYLSSKQWFREPVTDQWRLFLSNYRGLCLCYVWDLLVSYLCPGA